MESDACSANHHQPTAGCLKASDLWELDGYGNCCLTGFEHTQPAWVCTCIHTYTWVLCFGDCANTSQKYTKLPTQSAIQRHIPALIQSQVWCMLGVAPYYLLVKGMSHWREQVVTEHFNFPPLQAGRPGGVKRLAASDDSSPLMSITAINSTPGRMAQHSPPPAVLLPGIGFLYTPPLPAEGLELKLERWHWAIWKRSSEQAAAIHSSGSLSQIHCNTETGLGAGLQWAC